MSLLGFRTNEIVAALSFFFLPDDILALRARYINVNGERSNIDPIGGRRRDSLKVKRL